MNSRTPYLTICESGDLILDLRDGEETPVITSAEQLQRLAPHGCNCSSTVDFPEDYTTDPAVIALCRELRGGE